MKITLPFNLGDIFNVYCDCFKKLKRLVAIFQKLWLKFDSDMKTNVLRLGLYCDAELTIDTVVI